MSTLRQDIRFECRMLARNPGFTISVILILALGIGANTAIFSVVNAVLLRPLPYTDPDRIIQVQEQKLRQGIRNVGSSHPTLIYWRRHNQVFQDIAGLESRRFYVTELEKPRELFGSAVSPAYFSVMGMKPMLGREFLPEEEQPGRGHVVMLSFPFWREHMGADPHAIGKFLNLNG